MRLPKQVFDGETPHVQQQSRHMMAVGHGGFGSLLGILGTAAAEIPVFCRRQAAPEPTLQRRAFQSASMPHDLGLPSLWRKPASRLSRWADKLRAYPDAMSVEPGLQLIDDQQQLESNHKLMLAAFERETASPQSAERYLDQLHTHQTDPELQALLGQLSLIAGDRAAAALLLDWLNRDLSSGPALSRQVERALRGELKPLSPAVRAEAEQAIEAALPGLGVAAGG